MRTFHTGGTVSGGGGAFGGFETIEQFLQAPKTFKNKAVMAKEDGVISSITPGAAGGFHIHVGETEHFIHPDAGQQLLVKKGQKVAKGDLLNYGIPHPEEAIHLLGPIKGGHLVTDTLHDLYKGSSIKINRRNIETVMRGLTGFAKVKDPGTSNHVEGDITSLSRAMDFNANAHKVHSVHVDDSYDKLLAKPTAGLAAGTILNANHVEMLKAKGLNKVDIHHKPIEFERVYIGTDKAPNKSTDWIGSLSFRYLKRGIETGAAHAHMSDVHGYHPMAPFVTGGLKRL
jgi:hypothetical protein